MNKRRRMMIDSSVPAILFRELGDLSARGFSHRLAASEDRVLRFEIDRKLEKHRGCVNTIAFNEDGDILISGSDDRHIILWDWVTGISKLAFHSGHQNNVFHAKFMPYTNDKSIVSCAADGQVRHSEVLEGGDVKTSLLAKHQGGAHKLAIEPGSPHVFYSCGEDGVVQHFDLRTRTATELFTCHQGHARRRYSQMIQLNTITIDPRNANLFAVAGSDEYARLYDIRKYYSNGPSEFDQPVDYFCPPHLIGDRVGITGLAYSDHSELLASYNDESIYLFERGMGLGPSQVAHPSGSKRKGVKGGTSSGSSSVSYEDVAPQVYKGHRNRETVKGVGFFGPRCEYVVSGSDCGRIFIWKKKGGRLVRVMEADKDIVNCVESHPHIPVLASSGIESDVKIWTPTAIKKAVLPKKIDEVRPKARSWMYHVSPEDLLLQLFSSLQRRRTDPDHDGGDEANSTSGRELMELIRAYNLNNNNSSDDDDDDGDASGPEDFFS